MAASVALLALVGCGANGNRQSQTAEIKHAVMTEIKAINEDDCDAFYDISNVGDMSRSKYDSTFCAGHHLGLNGLQITNYTIVKVTTTGDNRAVVRVKYTRTDLNWGTTSEEDDWYATKIDGDWKVGHSFGL